MNRNKQDNISNHLRIYADRSEYFLSGEHIDTFKEGALSVQARERAITVKDAFENGFLDNLVSKLIKQEELCDPARINPIVAKSIDGLINSVTSEVGRALIGLSVMQLAIKSISPEQNIRLHKGSGNRNSFSWVEGISMRTLDKNYVTPILRKHNLLRLNADGFMMTRSLAENYPYTALYKAQLRGARKEWLELVDEIETSDNCPIEALKYLLSKLINKASAFESAAQDLLGLCKKIVAEKPKRKKVEMLICQHFEESNYAARLMEISMHALMQSVVHFSVFGLTEVKPLSQMRSANKKHGNIGDIELLDHQEIIESWDAKYGKAYLREEIEEVVEKLAHHGAVKRVGFVTNIAPLKNKEITSRIAAIKDDYEVEFEILELDKWVDYIYKSAFSAGVKDEQLSSLWLTIYCEYLSQKRRDQAPIDEPCMDWVIELTNILRRQ